MNFFLQEFFKGVKEVKGVKELRQMPWRKHLCFNFRKLAPHAQKGRA